MSSSPASAWVWIHRPIDFSVLYLDVWFYFWFNRVIYLVGMGSKSGSMDFDWEFGSEDGQNEIWVGSWWFGLFVVVFGFSFSCRALVGQVSSQLRV